MHFCSVLLPFANRFFSILRRANYVTPTSYLELIKTFKTLLNRKRMEILTLKNRYMVGLEKLDFAASQVGLLPNVVLHIWLACWKYKNHTCIVLLGFPSLIIKIHTCYHVILHLFPRLQSVYIKHTLYITVTRVCENNISLNKQIRCEVFPKLGSRGHVCLCVRCCVPEFWGDIGKGTVSSLLICFRNVQCNPV